MLSLLWQLFIHYVFNILIFFIGKVNALIIIGLRFKIIMVTELEWCKRKAFALSFVRKEKVELPIQWRGLERAKLAVLPG